MDIQPRDWKLFRKKIVMWQEGYMASLVKDYISILQEDNDASEKFWSLEKRLKEDKRRTGVQINLRRSQMIYDIVDLINDGAITLDDLSDFSDEIQERVKSFFEM